ncbi:hypothetical protein GCM10023310_65680 [Paenibacillus vulneris]|uniref:DUF11 domain-containing protein n=1 Tax=Paenibacillus vulneris TaxID=1133364 RepID=A0ABW3UKD7_9BACL
MPFILRYSDNDTGAITFTGNTLGLSRSNETGVPGTRDFIGAFVAIDTSMQFGSYPPGTTSDFNLNSASAILELPAGSRVKYAELVWAGTYAVTGGTNNYFAFIDKDVSLTTPQGRTFSISPDPVTAQTSHRNATDNYFRSANVTAIIQAGGAGVYTVGGVVGNIDLGNSTANNCGWTLCVVYENPGLPFRNLSLNVGIVEIAAGIPELTTTLTGFATPTSGAISGRMALCAQDGDANKTGDQVLFGPTEAALTVLEGPNNFPNNFFASQINDDSGNLDTTGTFGDRNQINGQPGTQIVGGRQSWDITNVDVSATLTNNQTSAVFQLRTGGDGYSVIAVGIYIDINSPRITVEKSVDAASASLGEILTYKVVVENSGTVPADTTLMFDSLPNDTEFVPGSVTINSTPITDADPRVGIPLGSVPPGAAVVVTYQVRVVSLPPEGDIVNEALVTFEYQSVTGGPILTGDITSNEVVTPVLTPDIALQKSVTPTEALPGETVEYRLEVVNTGEMELTNIRLTDTMLGLDQILPSLPIDTSIVITQSFTIPPGTPAGSVLLNTSTAQADQAGPVSDEAVVNVLPEPPVPVPAFTLQKSVTPTEARPGQTVEYRIEVTNTGEVDLTNIRITDAMLNLNEVLASLPVGSSTVITRRFTIPEGTPGGTIITNVSTAQTDQTGPVTDDARVTVLPEPPRPNHQLEIVKTADRSVVMGGQTIDYRITVTNTGDSVLTSVRVIDDRLGIHRMIGTLLPNQSVTVRAKFAVPADTEVGTVITNTAIAVSAETDPVSDMASVKVIGQPPLSVAKSVLPIESHPGSRLTFSFVVTNRTGTLTVANLGPTVLNHVTLFDNLPNGTQFTGGSVIVNNKPITGAHPEEGIHLGSLAPGETVRITFQALQVLVPSNESVENQAHVTFEREDTGETERVDSNIVIYTVTEEEE